MVSQIIGKSQAIRKIKSQINSVAKTEENILICGETGVGKDLVAQRLYLQSNRVGKPFVKLNCAGIAGSISGIGIPCFEQTGSKEDSKEDGQLFKKINGGTLYLDNIDLLSAENQMEILSLLHYDSHQVIDLKAPVPSDVRIVSSTNQDLEKLVSMGKFSERLYYRLSTVKIEIEPLRKRSEDIPFLIEYYIDKYASDVNFQRPMALSKKTIDRLCAHHWPGNVRELQNVLKRIILVDGEEGNVSDLIGMQKNRHAIIEADMPEEIVPTSDGFSDYFKSNAPELTTLPLKKARKIIVDMAEKQLISNVLEKTGWNRSKANKILDISYKTLLTKIKELNIKPPEQLLY
jgi:two-component system, NtrC family, response regulator AtoC